MAHGQRLQATSFKLQEADQNASKEARSFKLQAASLTAGPGDDRMNLERNNMDTTQLKRIADALEEILRLVKQDMEKYEKKKH